MHFDFDENRLYYTCPYMYLWKKLCKFHLSSSVPNETIIRIIFHVPLKTHKWTEKFRNRKKRKKNVYKPFSCKPFKNSLHEVYSVSTMKSINILWPSMTIEENNLVCGKILALTLIRTLDLFIYWYKIIIVITN